MKTETMKELVLKELENANGGAVIHSNGKYWAACDPENSYACRYVNEPFATVEEAQARAREEGWSDKIYTQEEYLEAFRRKIY